MNENVHLSGEQLEQLWEDLEGRLNAGDLVPRPEVAHVSECNECKRKWDLLSAAAGDLHPLATMGNDPPGPDCPAAEKIRALAAGTLAGVQADAVLEHVAACDHCGHVLRIASEDFGAELSAEEHQALGTLRSSQADWQRQMAARLSQAAAPASAARATAAPVVAMPARRGAWLRWAVATAAVVALVAGGLAAWRAWREPDVNQLLAQAYTEQRPMELRIAGAAHGPVRVERGPGGRSTFSKPPALNKAESLIAERLAAEPNNAKWLAASGRAELLNWNYEAAIKQLQRAQDHGDDLPGLLIDLASAYFQRATSEDDRAMDYALAVELLGKVLEKNPEEPVALFNRSVALARMGSLHEAARDLELYLRVMPRNDWTAEAHRRLEGLKTILNRSAKPSALVIEDPREAAAVLRARAENSPRVGKWPVSLDEEYIEVAVRRWLPALYSPSPDGLAPWHQDKEALATLEALSDVLHKHHRDLWLADLIRQARSERVQPAHFAAGATALKRAVEANLAGDPDSAIRFAKSARASFQSAGVRAAVLRAQEELLYARVRAMQTTACLREARDQLDDAEIDRYIWLRSQSLLWYSTCLAASGNLDEAYEQSRQALMEARSSAYGGQHLRGALFASGFLRTAELNWQMYLQALQLFWMDRNNPVHAYETFTELAILAEDDEKWHLARNLRREAAEMILLTPDLAYQAVAQYRLGVACKLANDLAGAEAAFSRANELFPAMPPTRTRDYYFNAAQVDLAAIELKQGKLDATAERLEGVKSSIENLMNSWLLFTYYNTLGELHLKLGKTSSAVEALKKALEQSEARLSSLKADSDRLVWQREMGPAYRNLTAAYLQQPGGEARALDFWEWYRASSLRSVAATPVARSGPPRQTSSTLEIPGILPSLTTKTFVSHMTEPSGVVTWVFDDRGIKFFRFAISANELERHARRFFLLCSDPSSEIRSLQSEGRLLYDVLFAPLEGLLEKGRTVVIIPDDLLRDLPWSALVNSQGQYLGTVYSTVVSPGFGYNLKLRPVRPVTPRLRALVVSIPSPGRAARFPPLPEADEEARQVAAHFLRTQLLGTGRVTSPRIRQELSLASVFHFAGHAISGPRISGLVLNAASVSGQDQEAPEVFTVSELRRDQLQNLQLVVLSACSTADTQRGTAKPDTLVQGFLRAGVPHVLATRWPVDSSTTTETMVQFYARLLGGAPVPVALQQTSANLRMQPKKSHPYYWAAFHAFGQ